MFKSVKILTVLAASLMVPVAAQAAFDHYDFEGLSTATLLDGQDNWITYSATATTTVETASPLGSPSTMAENGGQSSRVNDGTFSYAPHSASDTAAVMQFDGRNAVVGLGGNLTPNSDRLGFVFGNDTNSFVIRGAWFGTYNQAFYTGGDSGTDFYRLRLVVDFTANSGNGAGSLYVMNLTDGETSFRPTPVLSNINLEISNMSNAFEDPATWDSIYIRPAGAGDLVDNFYPHGVPEPASLGLLTVGGLLMSRRRRQR